ncbi:MAG: glycosyltransferase [Thaumarchaeota archaeon]|nr:glycosyltransferase [Nitrososphaerota archaeon]
MNILVIHEVDWLKKVTYEIHHLSELFSLHGHNVYAIDVPDPGVISFNKSIFRSIPHYHRVYSDASVTLLRTPIIPIKGLHRISSYLMSYYHIKKILKKYKIDIVFLFGVVTNGQATIKACKELHIPVVHRTLDILHELVREKFLRKHVLKIEQSIYPQFDKVLCQTPFMKKWVDEMGTIDSDVIPQGVDSSIMKLLPPDIELRNKLGIKEEDKVVMYLGTTYSFSGLDAIIEKVSSISEEIPEFKLLVVGGGPDLPSFKQLAKQYGVENRVIFTGVVPYLEVSKYCSLAKIFINPFRINEITDRLSPVKIFDLLSCGKPVIATPLQGLLHDFPINSEVLTYCQVDEFDKKIILLLKQNSLEQMGLRGREYVEKNYTWTKVTEKILEEFESLVSRKKSQNDLKSPTKK